MHFFLLIRNRGLKFETTAMAWTSTTSDHVGRQSGFEKSRRTPLAQRQGSPRWKGPRTPRRLAYWRERHHLDLKKGKRAIGLRYDLTGLDNGDPVESIKPVNVDADYVFKGDETGTVLRVGGFPERLTSPQNFCQKIHRELHLLPDPFSGLSDFEIKFTPPREVKKLQNLDLRELVENSLYSADFIVTGGEVRGEFRNKNPFCPKSGDPLFINKRLKDMVPNAFTLTGINIRIRAFNKHKIYGPVCFNVEGIGRVKQESFNEITGFRLYKDGIRVQPYGQQGLGRDWLGWTTSGANEAIPRSRTTKSLPRPTTLLQRTKLFEKRPAGTASKMVRQRTPSSRCSNT